MIPLVQHGTPAKRISLPGLLLRNGRFIFPDKPAGCSTDFDQNQQHPCSVFALFFIPDPHAVHIFFFPFFPFFPLVVEW